MQPRSTNLPRGHRSSGTDGWAGSVEGKGGGRAEQCFGLEKMGEWNRKDCGRKRWLLFEGPEPASCDLSGTSDDTVEIIINNTPTGVSEYTVDIFSN